MATTEAIPPAPVPGPPPSGFLERRFHVAARGSTVRTELVAGVVTFLTMAYIMFVNPAVLGGVADPSGRELPFDQLLTVTALVAGVMTILMGLVAVMGDFMLRATADMDWSDQASASPRSSRWP